MAASSAFAFPFAHSHVRAVSCKQALADRRGAVAVAPKFSSLQASSNPNADRKTKTKPVSFGDRLLDYIEGGPKLRKWYGAPEELLRNGAQKDYDETSTAGECTAALRIFREMIADSCHPNEMTFSCLINAFGKEGQVEEAESIFEAMSDYVVTPNVVVYNTMIDLYNKNGLPNHAQHMFHKMIEIGMEPTYASFTSLMSSFKALEAYEEAVDVYYSVRGNSSLCNVYTYTEALDSCLKWGNWEKVAEVLSDMQFAGCVPNFVTCSVLLAALGSRCRNAEEANIIVDFLKSYESKLLVNVRRMLVEIFDADLEVRSLSLRSVCLLISLYMTQNNFWDVVPQTFWISPSASHFETVFKV